MTDHGQPLIFPVGHYLGEHHPGPGEAASHHDVRIGWQSIPLSDEEQFDVWSLAHGNPAWSEAREWTLADVWEAATNVGVRDPARVTAELLDSGALVEVERATDAMVDFASAYRLEPLLVGLGNGPSEPLDQIGVPGLLSAAKVAPRIYELWQWAHVWPDLWSACEGLAAVSAELGSDFPEESDPLRVLAFALDACQLLIGHGVAYLDAARRPGF